MLSIGKTITACLPAAVYKALPVPGSTPFCHCLSSLVFTTQALTSAVNVTGVSVLIPFYIGDCRETKTRNSGRFRNLRNVTEEHVAIVVDELERRIKLVCTGGGNQTSPLTLPIAYRVSSTPVWLLKSR